MVTVDITADPRVFVLVEKEVAEGGTRLVDSGEVTCTCTCKCVLQVCSFKIIMLNNFLLPLYLVLQLLTLFRWFRFDDLGLAHAL